MNFAGLPPYTEKGGILQFTKLFGSIIEHSPMVTPTVTMQAAPMWQWSPIVIGALKMGNILCNLGE